jgi:hypothetical protein
VDGVTTGSAAPPTPAAEPSLVPKEHGASFMAVHACVLGAVAGIASGGRDWVGLAVGVSVGALFLPIAGAVSVWSHPRFRARARRRVAILGAVLAVASAAALAVGPVPELLACGAVMAALGGGYALARTRTGARSMPSQLTAIASITVLGPVVWLLVAGATDRWQLAAPAAFLSFGGSVPYVRARVRRRRVPEQTLGERLQAGAAALGWQAAAVAAALAVAVAGVVAWLVPVAYLPGAAKTFAGIARRERRPPIARIGYLETAVSSLFVILAGLGLAAAPA